MTQMAKDDVINFMLSNYDIYDTLAHYTGSVDRKKKLCIV